MSELTLAQSKLSLIGQLTDYHEAKLKQAKPVRQSTPRVPRAALMKQMYKLREHMPITIIELRTLANFPQEAMSSQISSLIKLGFLVRCGKRQSTSGLNRKVTAFEFTQKGLEYARTC